MAENAAVSVMGATGTWAFLGRRVSAPSRIGEAQERDLSREPADLDNSEETTADFEAPDALELAVEMAEALRIAEDRISALEAENVEMRTRNLEIRNYVGEEIPALEAEVKAASDRAAAAETIILALADREQAALQRMNKAEGCLGQVRKHLQSARDMSSVARQRRAAAA